ncbi:hypothetical protein [Collimonas arenae]|uniref:hypothetical protein n=1 Tax=Collimonas arenae TaxID=279058 RepID=UPI0012E0280B|nr:hypothetical protein [Collimonas arenae]
MKKLLLLLAVLVASTAFAGGIYNPISATDTIQVNQNGYLVPVPVTVVGASASSPIAAITSGSISGLSPPLPIASGGTSSATATGTGSVVLQTSPTLTTPVIGAATGTSLSLSGVLTPSTTAGIVGTTLGDSAQAGSVGEVITSSIASGSAVALTTGTSATITSISLTPGDWDVTGLVVTGPAGTTTQTNTVGGISSVTNAFSMAQSTVYLPFAASAGNSIGMSVTTRINISSTATYYLVVQSTFAVSTNGGYGTIFARRRR